MPEILNTNPEGVAHVDHLYGDMLKQMNAVFNEHGVWRNGFNKLGEALTKNADIPKINRP